MSKANITVLRPSELSADDLATWRTLAAEGYPNPFLAPEFAVAVDHARDGVRVALVEEAGQTAGFFPFETDHGGVGRPVGAGICDAQAFVCNADLDWSAPWLIAASGLRGWHFDHLDPSQKPF